MPGIFFMPLTEYLTPILHAQVRKEDVALDFGMNERAVKAPEREFACLHERQSIHMTAAYDHGLWLVRAAHSPIGVVKSFERFRSRASVVRVLAEYEIASSGQGRGHTLKSPATHDHRLSLGVARKPAHVIRELPGQTIILADDAVFGHGPDERRRGQSGITRLNRNGCGDGWMELVVLQAKILVLKCEDILDFGIDLHRRKR